MAAEGELHQVPGLCTTLHLQARHVDSLHLLVHPTLDKSLKRPKEER
jgi:hypothetical protein